MEDLKFESGTFKDPTTGNDRTLRFKPLHDILHINNQPPAVFIGLSKCGKTTICMDLIRKYAPQCSNIYFITNTMESIKEPEIALIPNFMIRRPKQYEDRGGFVGALSDVWKLTMQRFEWYNPEMLTYENLLNMFYPGANLKNRIFNYVMSKNLSDNERNEAFREIVKRVVASKIDTDPTVLTRIPEKYLNFVRGLFSTSQSTLIIIDDCTESIKEAGTSNTKILAGTGSLATKVVLNNLLTEVFNRARHYSCLVCIFLHNFDALEKLKTNVNTFGLLGNVSLEAYYRASTYAPMNKVAKAADDQLHIYKDYKYHFLMTDALNNEIYVTKAQYTSPKVPINFSPKTDFIREAFNKIYTKHALNTKQLLPARPSTPAPPLPPPPPAPVQAPAPPPAVVKPVSNDDHSSSLGGIIDLI